MSADLFFLDTNIAVYAFESETGKKKIAEDLLHKAGAGKGCVSFQVVQEFINTALRKFRPALPFAEIRGFAVDVLLPLCRLHPNASFYLDALDTHHLTGFSWCDSLILQAAVDAGCRTLYSEDLPDGFQYRGVTVKNPFRTRSASNR